MFFEIAGMVPQFSPYERRDCQDQKLFNTSEIYDSVNDPIWSDAHIMLLMAGSEIPGSNSTS